MRFRLIFVFLGLLTVSLPALSDDTPWFTGPLLSGSPVVTPLGTVNTYLDMLSQHNSGIYQNDYDFISTPRYLSSDFSPSFVYGLTNDVDFGVELDYLRNQNEGQSYSGLGDTNMNLGFQLMTQGTSKNRSNIKLTLHQLFPTGRYDQLDPQYYTSNALGVGSYHTGISIVGQHLFALQESHYLNVYGGMTLTYASSLRLHGLSTYGGGRETDGIIYPGDSLTADLAAEYLISKNWVAVIEGYFLGQRASHFVGRVGNNPAAFIEGRLPSEPGSHRILFNRIMPNLHNLGNYEKIGSGNVAQITLAPALEYNFSDDIGIIGGAWFSVSGKNAPAFFTTMLRLCVTW